MVDVFRSDLWRPSNSIQQGSGFHTFITSIALDVSSLQLDDKILLDTSQLKNAFELSLAVIGEFHVQVSRHLEGSIMVGEGFTEIDALMQLLAIFSPEQRSLFGVETRRVASDWRGRFLLEEGQRWKLCTSEANM